jgi:predicted GNAT family N-acyltransferase
MSTVHPKSNLMPMIIKPPSECTDNEMIGFKGMVLQGRQVTERGLDDLIKQAVFLAFHYEGDQLAGVAALKKPRNEYKSRIFQKAGVVEQADKFDLEIGWAFTLREYEGRHICSNLIQNLIERSESQNMYATTSTKNSRMDRILSRFGFEKAGGPYKGRRDQLQLYLRH